MSQLEEVRAALDECDLRPHGSLADRIRALTHHHREWKSLYADAANKLAETQRALSDARNAAYERAAQECESLLTKHGMRSGGGDGPDAARRMCALRIRMLKTPEAPK